MMDYAELYYYYWLSHLYALCTWKLVESKYSMYGINFFSSLFLQM